MEWGVGFLVAKGGGQTGYRIICSAEINPIYLRSLENNYKYFAQNFPNKLGNSIPSEFFPIDLTKNEDRNAFAKVV